MPLTGILLVSNTCWHISECFEVGDFTHIASFTLIFFVWVSGRDADTISKKQLTFPLFRSSTSQHQHHHSSLLCHVYKSILSSYWSVLWNLSCWTRSSFCWTFVRVLGRDDSCRPLWHTTWGKKINYQLSPLYGHFHSRCPTCVGSGYYRVDIVSSESGMALILFVIKVKNLWW